MRIGDRVAVYGIVFEEEVSDKGVKPLRLTGRIERFIGEVIVIRRDVTEREMYVHRKQCELLGVKRFLPWGKR